MKFSLLIACCLFAGMASAVVFTKGIEEGNPSEFSEQKWETEFMNWKLRFEKTYEAEEHALRFEIFKKNIHLAHKLQQLDQGTAQYGASPFADLSPDEFFMLYRRPMDISNRPRNPVAEIPQFSPDELPAHFDWKEEKKVTAVKNQGQCGSCWSFSTTGNIESVRAVAGLGLTQLSEQQMVDCDKTDNGCNGGLMDNAFIYVARNKLTTEEAYPYTAAQGSCKYTNGSGVATVSSHYDLPHDEEKIQAYLYAHNALSIGVNAEWMQFYMGGVSDPLFCPASGIDHGVLLTGWSHEDKGLKKGPYWIIKNSWGPKWGEEGYYWLAGLRGSAKCGIDQACSTATL
eukprot:GCRY01000210.1.p1 GENE.GCRY01000210.1~~GCRY01000210.1.p1  ORF type:complete len:366 (+),score=72.37 GCRY01000210.1:71-1099(+)